MNPQASHDWCIVLAGGQGRRLRSLTTTAAGITVPKQFCSLQGGASLLQETLRRAENLVPREHICVVVSAQHRHWWQPTLTSLPAENVIVEPLARGTAVALLAAALHIVTRDPHARIVALPSDHHIQDEPALAQALHYARSYLEPHPDKVILLGMEPDDPDGELGYVLPGKRNGFGTFDVKHIVEKPNTALAQELIEKGALWNSFILVTTAASLVGLFENIFPELIADARTIVENYGRPLNAAALMSLYQSLPTLDFSTDVLQSSLLGAIRVVPVPYCGWSDLGTPRRVANTLERMLKRRAEDTPQPSHLDSPINLARQERLYHSRISSISDNV